MRGKMLAAITVVVLMTALAGSASATEDDYVQVYITIDSNRVDIFIEGSNLEDELATIDVIGDALERLYGITANIYYHVNELDDVQKREMQRSRDIEAELKRGMDQNASGISQNASDISNTRWTLWVGLSDLGRGLNETQTIMLCLFAISICLMTIMYSLNKQSVWGVEKEQDKLKRRVSVLEATLRKGKVKIGDKTKQGVSTRRK